MEKRCGSAGRRDARTVGGGVARALDAGELGHIAWSGRHSVEAGILEVCRVLVGEPVVLNGALDGTLALCGRRELVYTLGNSIDGAVDGDVVAVE